MYLRMYCLCILYMYSLSIPSAVVFLLYSHIFYSIFYSIFKCIHVTRRKYSVPWCIVIQHRTKLFTLTLQIVTQSFHKIQKSLSSCYTSLEQAARSRKPNLRPRPTYPGVAILSAFESVGPDRPTRHAERGEENVGRNDPTDRPSAARSTVTF